MMTAMKRRRATSAVPAAARYATATGSTSCSRVSAEYLNPGNTPTARASGMKPNMQASSTASSAIQNHRRRALRLNTDTSTSGMASRPA